jgi:hypothetical protein
VIDARLLHQSTHLRLIGPRLNSRETTRSIQENHTARGHQGDNHTDSFSTFPLHVELSLAGYALSQVNASVRTGHGNDVAIFRNQRDCFASDGFDTVAHAFELGDQ